MLIGLERKADLFRFEFALRESFELLDLFGDTTAEAMKYGTYSAH